MGSYQMMIISGSHIVPNTVIDIAIVIIIDGVISDLKMIDKNIVIEIWVSKFVSIIHQGNDKGISISRDASGRNIPGLRHADEIHIPLVDIGRIIRLLTPFDLFVFVYPGYAGLYFKGMGKSCRNLYNPPIADRQSLHYQA